MRLRGINMWKVFAILSLILIIAVIILILIIKSKNKEIKNQINQINNLLENGKELEIKNEKLLEEMQIEKNHNQELAKKLADISCMSIDDVMHQLQND